ncbi:hypothetical protein FKM82_018269 [Ascaphus truei]
MLSCFNSALSQAKQSYFSSLINMHKSNPHGLFSAFDSLLRPPSAASSSSISPPDFADYFKEKVESIRQAIPSVSSSHPTPLPNSPPAFLDSFSAVTEEDV